MSDVTLIIHTAEGARQISLDGDRLTIGRTELAMLVVNDEGLSRLHASINRSDDRVWVLDENSTNGSLVNNSPVSASGTMLRNGDQISIGNHTTIQVLIGYGAAPIHAGAVTTAEAKLKTNAALAASASSVAAPDAARASKLPLIAAVVAAVLLLMVAAAVIGVRAWQNRTEKAENRSKSRARQQPTLVFDEEPESTSAPIETTALPTPSVAAPDNPLSGQTLIVPTPQLSATAATAAATTPFPLTPAPPQLSNIAPFVQRSTASKKLYLQMAQQEQMAFVEQSAQHIAAMMGNGSYAFTPEALALIKGYVDNYAPRVGNNSTRLWAEDLRSMFERARTQYTPHIIRAFKARGVPPVVGVYLCVIETEYHNIESENFAGAAGLFQFLGSTAEDYGVPRAERTNVEKMAPAAAAYMADRIKEFGTDSMSVALGIAGYNRSPASVRRDLHNVLNSENKERSFWTLIVNSTKLDHYFQGENIKYVPKFFAAAIVGEHPWAFGLDGMRPLTTYDELPIK